MTLVLVKSKIKSTPETLIASLAGIACVLAVVNIIIQFAMYSFGLKKEWFLLFNMDKELNIPTIFSCALLLICASLSSIASKHIKSNHSIVKNKWRVLNWFFIFLALDEGLQIHEVFIIPSIKPMLPAILTVVWVIPYSLLALSALIYFIPLLTSLPRNIKYLTIISGTIYVTGALVLEMIGSFLVRTGDIRLHGVSYGLISTLEETLEITGLIVFIYTLLTYIVNYQNQKLKLKLSLSRKKTL